eukprot:55306-Pyramimonas_sp.AAC.1
MNKKNTSRRLDWRWTPSQAAPEARQGTAPDARPGGPTQGQEVRADLREICRPTRRRTPPS